jgi:4-hydroxy-tetrahydrodipicolinate reductase
MKVAVIGTGKTGQAIQDLLPEGDIVAVCNSRNPVTADKIAKADVGIVFVPAHALTAMLSELIASRKPMIVGTTGFEWPHDIDQQLKATGVAWIVGPNFSIGLNVMRYFAQRIQSTLNALRDEPARLAIHEKHHTHKLDAPSGTALSLAKALAVPTDEIMAVREGDAKGAHTVSFDWPHDRISLTHETLDRAAFAEGVLLACAHISAQKSGLHFFETLADDMSRKVDRG